MTFELRAQIQIAAGAEQVWHAVTDWEGQRDWVPATVVHVTSGDGRSVGSRLLAFTGLLDVGFADHLEIVRWQPPHVCTVRHLGKLVRGEGEFVVEPRGEAASTFTWIERLEPPLGVVGQLGLAMLAPVARFTLRRAVRALAVSCEAAVS